MKYKQLTQEQRYQIDAYSKAGWLQKDIAQELKCDRTTLYREKNATKGSVVIAPYRHTRKLKRENG